MKYTEKYFVLSHDISANGLIRPSNIMRYMQETANHHMRDAGPSYDELFREGKSFILSRINIEVLRPIWQYEELTVSTWPSSKGVTFLRSYEIRRAGELVAQGIGTWALVDVKTKRFFRAGEVELNYGEEPPLEATLSKRVVIPNDFSLEYKGSHAVTYMETDMNRHLNSSNYPDILAGFIPGIENLFMTGMALQFVAEAGLGSVMDIFVAPGSRAGAGEKFFVRSSVQDKPNVAAEFNFAKL